MKYSLSILMVFQYFVLLTQVTHLLDADFSCHGYYLEDSLLNARVIGIDSAERIYLIGKKADSNSNTFHLKRINEFGELDLEYGMNGYVELITLFESHDPKGIILDNDDILISFYYTLGWTDQPKNYVRGSYYQIFKITQEGKLDHSFADDGAICKGPGRLLNATNGNRLLYTNSDSLVVSDSKMAIDSSFLKNDNNRLNFYFYNYSLVSCKDKEGSFLSFKHI